jgi:uncharacterized membrane protein (Fun14 family)
MADDKPSSGEGSKSLFSGFQVVAIITALIVTVAGVVGTGWSWMNYKDDRQHLAAMPDNVRSAVEQSAATDPEVGRTQIETWTEWASTRGIKLGLSFLGAFAIGFAFRTFLKTMAILTALSVTTILLLSYFNVFNVDFSHVQQQWDSNSEWITTQAGKLKDLVWSHLPSSTMAFAGLFVGMLRR